jgi:ribosomal protein S4
MGDETFVDEKSKMQCPIGYHLEQSSGLVLSAKEEDKKQHSIEFKCVVDAARDYDSNSPINQ